jgi:hypothetical protein
MPAPLAVLPLALAMIQPAFRALLITAIGETVPL